MQVINLDLNSIVEIKEKLSLCIGFFDGVHLGHLSLINKAQKLENKIGVMSFETTPSAYKTNGQIMTLNQKIEKFKTLGVDYLFLLKVDQNLLNLSPIEFIQSVLKKINIDTLICGEDFRFGKNRKGDVELLKKYFNVISMPLLTVDGIKVSSTIIKDYISNGQIKSANELLGDVFSISGTIKKGFQKGRELGFKTININFDVTQYVVPKYGVYLVNVKIFDQIYDGLANVGCHPSINKLDKPIIEVNLFDFKQEVDNIEAECHFLEFIRPEHKFETVDELKNQVLSDIKNAKKFIKENKKLQS